MKKLFMLLTIVAISIGLTGCVGDSEDVRIPELEAKIVALEEVIANLPTNYADQAEATVLLGLIQELQAWQAANVDVDTDTVYDEAAVLALIAALDAKVDLDTVYDETAVLALIAALDAKVD